MGADRNFRYHPKASETHEPPLGPMSGSPPNLKRYFEFTGGSSRKFWEISLSGDCFTVRFGRIGTLGQSQTKKFANEINARREFEHLIAEKTKKGYFETPKG